MKTILTFMSLTSVSILLFTPPLAHADILAVTHADFSTAAQGTNGFYYGYYNGPDSTTHEFLSGAGQVESGMDGPRPMWRAIAGSGLPNVVSFMQHPGPSGEGSRPAVRRYVVGASGEPAYTGTVRVVGRFYDLNDGSTKVFVAVDQDGDATGATRNLLPPEPVPPATLAGPTPVTFDFTTTVSPGTTIDFGVLPNGEYYSDATGLAAWIVTEDVAVPTNVLATNYNSPQFSTGNGVQDTRGLIFALVTDGVLSGTDLGSFDTSPGTTYTHAGLLYSENAGSGKVTRFNSVRIDVTTGADFAELPHLFLLRHNSDPGSLDPSQDERYVQLPVTAVRTAANIEGQPYYTFDLSSLPESQRTGYGFTVFGRGSYSAGAIAVSEIAADAVRVSDSGYVPAQPTWIEYGGHRYAVTFTRGTWEQCQAEAVSYGGYLVSINSAEENEWVFDAFGRGESVYIGLRQNPLQTNVEPNGGWTWMDGTVMSDINGNNIPGVYRNWNDVSVGGTEPNHAYGAGEDYGFFAASVFNGRSTWGDIKNAGFPETSNYRGIIELPSAGSSVNGRNYHFTVSGQANIFGAGQPNPTPATDPASGGVAAPWRTVYAGERVRITASSGTVYTGAETGGVDGTHHSTKRCDITGVGGISGYLNGNNSAHLVGVFVGYEPLSQTPERIDFSTNATGEAFATLSPGLGQVFFIGDGLAPGGKVQEFVAPEGAVRLYLGVPDAWRAENPDHAAVYVGPPNAYGDNTGSWSVRLAVSPSLTPHFNDTRFPASGTPFSLSGGQAPYDPITVSAGSLPPGITINDKTVTGRATEDGQYTFTLRSQDALDVEATKSFTVNVAPAPGSMITWWKGDQGGEDSAGTNHATFGGNANVVTGGIVGGKGFLFDGTDDILTVPDTDALDLTGDFTVEAWVDLYSNVGQEPAIVSKRSTDSREVSYVLFIETDGRLTFASRALDSQSRDWVETSTPSGVTVGNDGFWKHVAVTCSGSTMKFYLNGTLVHTGTHPARPPTSTPLTIGAGTDGSAVFGDWDGFIDELSIYNRALKASEISAIAGADSLGKVFRVKPAITDEDFPFTGGQLALEGGTSPYTVTITAGILPSGLSISEGGLVSGMAANGPYCFTLRVAESGNPLNYTERVFTGTLENPIPVPLGIAAWWAGENSVADIIGGNHAAATDNNPQYVAGKVGRAFSFNGISQSLSTPTATQVMKQLPLTLEAWVKPEARTSGSINDPLPTNVISNDLTLYGGHGFGVHLYPDGSKLNVGIEGESEDFRTVPGVTFSNNTWVHISVVYTPGNVKTYVNGTLLDDYSFTQGEINGDTTIRIGRHNDDTGYGSRRFFKGAIDEVALYHRALSDSEVQAQCLAGSAGRLRHDAARDYSTTSNPGTRWSYHWLRSDSLGGTYDPQRATGSAGALLGGLLPSNNGIGANGLHGWVGASSVSLNTLQTNVIIYNGGTQHDWLPRQMGMGPGPSHQFSVARWTAPQSGRYAISGSFFGCDTRPTTVDVHILLNEAELMPVDKQTLNGYRGNGVSHTRVLDVEAGNTVDFILGVGSNNDWTYDSTGVAALITPLGPILAAPTNLAIQTQSPPTAERLWVFKTNRTNDLPGLALRVQYAESATPNTWVDLDVEDGSNSMTPPETGSDEWTLLVSSLDLPAGNYRFRVTASATSYMDKPGPAFGVDALGESGTDPIAITVPGQPPPPPVPLAMPAAIKVTYSIGGKAGALTAKQGAVAKFTVTQPLPSGTPTPNIEVQWSSTPNDEQSWEDVDEQNLTYNKTTKTWLITATHLPAVDGVYFRVLTQGKGRTPTAGPVVSGSLKLMGPVNISPGALWRYAKVEYFTSSDSSGDTANTGDTITYRLTFKNEGAANATNIEAAIQMPSGVDFVSSTDGVVPKLVGSVKKAVWKLASLPPNMDVIKELTVRIRTSAGSKITLPPSGVTVKCAEIPTPLQAVLQGRASRKSIETLVFSSLRLGLESSLSGTSHVPAGIARMGEVIYYTLTAENRSASPVANAVATFRVPLGMHVEHLRLPDGNGNFIDSIFTNPSPSSNPSLTPYEYLGQQLITWKWDSLPANSTRTMKFALRVMQDLDPTRIENGVYETNTVSADDYNLSGKAGTKVVKAFTGKGPPVTFGLDASPGPTRAPNLKLVKSATADGQGPGPSPAQPLLATEIPGVGRAAAPYKGTRITYKLNWSNALFGDPSDPRLPESARNVVIHEEIPSGTHFFGWVRRNGTLLSSSTGFTFRTKDGWIVPIGGEPFADTDGDGRRDFRDTNNNGVRDGTETYTEVGYTDSNGNKRFDDITDIRYIDIALGTQAAGASGYISYDVVATGEEGNPIVSRSESSIIPDPVGGMYYEGYSIWCENCFLPGASSPEELKSMITRPVSFEPPAIWLDRTEPEPNDVVNVEIPYTINGLAGSAFQEFTVTFTVPKPLTLDTSRVGQVDLNVPLGSSQRPLRAYHADDISPFRRGESHKLVNRTSDTQLVFNLGGLKGGYQGVLAARVKLPATYPSSLLTSDLCLKAPFELKVEISHKQVGSTKITPSSTMAVLEARTLPVGAASAPAEPRSASTRNVTSIKGLMSRLFVGRTAPFSVKAGDFFDMHIFFGNASNTLLQRGQVWMVIPDGLKLESQTPVTYYYTGSSGPAGDNLFDRADVAKVIPDGSRQKFVIETLDMFPHCMGAVRLTFRVDPNFTGKTIEDATLCAESPNTFPSVVPRLVMTVQQQESWFSALAGFLNKMLGSLFNGINEQARTALAAHEHTFRTESRWIGLAHADFVHLSNGTVVIPLLGGRSAVIGPSHLVDASDGNIIGDDGAVRIAVGHESVAGFQIKGIQGPGWPAPQTWRPDQILYGLLGHNGNSANLVHYNAANIFLNNGSNMVAAGAGNMVAAGGLNLINNSSGLAAGSGLNYRYSNMVAAGGLNMVAAGAGNIVAAGGLNMVAAGAGNMVAAGGLNMVAAGGLNMVAAGAGNLVAAGGGNMVAAGAGNMVAAGGLNFSATAVSSMISTNASALQAARLSGAGLIESVSRNNLIGILSHNGGQVLSHNGGLFNPR